MYKCQSCGYTKLESIVDLGAQPICNRFLNSRSEFRTEKKYPLKLVYCPKCNLVQLSYTLPTSVTFDKNFNYLTGTNPEIIDYFDGLAKVFMKRFRLSGRDYVVDIGSNDGTALVPFKKKGINVLGVDPAPKPARIAQKEGIDTIIDSFENSIQKIMNKTNGRIKLVTAYNVLAHTHDINEFLDGIRRLLESNKDAVFVSQSHYFVNLVDKCEFDTIYHEHARYYTLTSLKAMFATHGLHLYHAEKAKFYGGSILVYAGARKPTKAEGRNVEKFIRMERKYTGRKSYDRLARSVTKKKDMLRKIIIGMKSEGKHVAGIGAPMKSSTLLNYCRIDSSMLDYLAEVNSLKIGTFSPGMHIPVVDEKRVLKDKPDAVLILSWNLSDNIIKSLRTKGYRGGFIVPLPFPKVIKSRR